MATSTKTLFLTGGAGYLGKCTAAHLVERGYQVFLLDDYSTSRPLKNSPFTVVEVDLTDREALGKAWKGLPKPDGIIHFAARALVPQSCEDPGLYFRVNLGSANNVAELASETGSVFLHSSSCAVYGVPETLPLTENSPRRPISPYGETKKMVEDILEQYRIWKKLTSLSLRYFNPVGAIHWKGVWLGEAHEPETHLVPLVVRALMSNEKVVVFGDDYPTPDGTCVRDFIHVADLAEAHGAALEYLFRTPSTDLVPALNVGGGRGVSVLEIAQAAMAALGVQSTVEKRPRREGDPAELVADTSQSQKVLNWKPRRTLKEMIESHFQYLQSLPAAKSPK